MTRGYRDPRSSSAVERVVALPLRHVQHRGCAGLDATHGRAMKTELATLCGACGIAQRGELIP